MATVEMFRSEEDSRREWRRVPAELTMRCRRLGPSEDEKLLDTIDLSPGGARLRAPDWLTTGDVVSCWMNSDGQTSKVGLKGLVVQARPHEDETCDVHVAWTNLSPESSEELGRLLILHEAQRSAEGTKSS